jgi:hypothetical protein
MHVDKVKPLAFDVSSEMRQLVETSLDLAPVVSVAPVVDQPAEIIDSDARTPSARVRQLAPVVRLHPDPDRRQTFVRNVDGVWVDHLHLLETQQEGVKRTVLQKWRPEKND